VSFIMTDSPGHHCRPNCGDDPQESSTSSDVCSQALQDLQVVPFRPSAVLPKLFAWLIVGKQENVALQDAERRERSQARLDQLPPPPLLAITGAHRQMVQVSTSPVVSTQDGSDNAPFIPDHEAQLRIAVEVTRKLFGRVRLIESHSLGFRPQLQDVVQV